MNAAIVDTDVVSMLFKGDTRAIAFRPLLTGRLLGISFMTLAELERLAARTLLGANAQTRTGRALETLRCPARQSCRLLDDSQSDIAFGLMTHTENNSCPIKSITYIQTLGDPLTPSTKMES